MLVLARPRQDDEEADSGHEEEADDMEEDHNMDILRYSQDFDLSGSFAARDRRRGRQVTIFSSCFCISVWHRSELVGCRKLSGDKFIEVCDFPF